MLPDVCRHLAQLLEAGIPLADAVKVSAFRAGSGADQLLELVGAAVNQGATLASAWDRCAPRLLLLLLSVGDETGRLAEMLASWVRYVERREAWRRQWGQSLAYPAVVFTACVAMTVFIRSTVLPVFAHLYTSLGGDGMHLLVRFQMLIDAFLGIVSGMTLISVAGIVTAVLAERRQWPWWSRVRTRLPGWRWYSMDRSRTLCHMLRMLLQAGVPIVQALTVLQGSDELWVTRAVAPVYVRLLGGARVGDAFISGVWAELIRPILDVADRTGDLAGALERAERVLDATFERELRAFLKILEPMAICVLGAVVAGTMWMLFVPIYESLAGLSAGSAALP